MLNDERMFIPFETTDGTIVIYKKNAIKRLTELFAAERSATRDPYDIIDVSAKATDKELHEAYRRAIASVHPDHIQSLGLPQEFIELATRRAMAVNDAYDRIRKERGWRAASSRRSTRRRRASRSPSAPHACAAAPALPR
jgi:hypothetical protein